ncbi:MAG TPA: beta-ketoacyl-[acyl-carrier-protein] synthase II [Dehalococcoidia bacterium]|nr:beta-ketoacyl-[acyl-carrier-protein] synthase II [Chloroflexota bacterium]HCE76847.1 beta-ketoacyl-[acyl-carrier-protein] synthase II [Dehalococcoidia bacterium]|tara:strand:+ start:5398 stop:6636 length:1239 start_codon:yes stop_codon:yes gene_type:complete
MVERVFITGVGSISPVGLTIDETWSSLTKGVSGIDTISSFDSEGYETTIAAEATDFDPQNYLDRKQAKRMDRFVQLAAAASLEALEKSGLTIDKTNEERISVMVASGIGGIITLSEQIGVLNSRGPNRVSPFLVPMMLPDMASGQVSMLLGAKGANYCTVSACASGADSIGMAFEAIRRGDVDGAIAGGAEAAICPVGVAGFNACQALSKRNNDPQTASRPFDKDRDGFVLGEGAGVLVLENESSINARGAEPIAEMIGYGATADAYHITQPGPEGEGGARAMNIALGKAHILPEEIDYINAHGTSTPLNDKFETMAMKSVFGKYAYDIPISSTKSMTGHLLGASGALEAAITVMALKNQTVPPTINLKNQDPDCDLDYTPGSNRKLPLTKAMSNSFGFGGHNASLIFQNPS